MTQATRNGIVKDLKNTPYKRIVGLTCYHFSSKFYLTGFDQRLYMNREKINKSLSERFGFTVNVDTLADLWLYSKIEKRGFYVMNTESGATLCHQEEAVYNGGMLMKKHSQKL